MKARRVNGNRDCRGGAATRGFTIAEILVAILITGIVAGVIYGSYMGSLKIIRYAKEDSERAHMARIVLDRISSDLACAFLRGYKEYLVFVGMDGSVGDREADSLTFIAADHERSGRDAAESDLSEVSYFLDPESGDELYILRREDPTLDEDPFSGGETRIIGEGIAGLSFEYFDGETWYPSWDSREENELPVAVRVSLLFRTEEETGEAQEEGEETVRYTTYRTETAIPLGGSWEDEEDEEEETGEQAAGKDKEKEKVSKME